jgi:hypothetical protein
MRIGLIVLAAIGSQPARSANDLDDSPQLPELSKLGPGFHETTNAAGEPLVAFELHDSRLRTVLQWFSRPLHRRIELEGAPNERIALRSPGFVPAEQAWAIVVAWLEANGFAVQDRGDTIYVSRGQYRSGRDEGPDDAVGASAAGAPGAEAPMRELGDAGVHALRVGGRLVGFRLGVVPAGGLLEAIGLRDGDTVLECNGVPMDDESRVQDLIQILSEAVAIRLTVNGEDGDERILEYQRPVSLSAPTSAASAGDDPTTEQIECGSPESRPTTGKDVFCYAKSLPEYAEGRMIGVGFVEIVPNSFLSNLGLADGDLVISFNGKPIVGGRESALFFRAFAEAQVLRLVVIDSSGRERSIEVEF